MKELKEFLDKYNVKYIVKGEYIIGGDVNLSYKEITKLPESIGNLRCNTLDLYNNKINKLPESIGNLRCNVLRLYCNKISELPESIGNLKCNELYLDHNQISELPESICNIKCNALYLHNNQISVLPESIDNLRCNYLNLGNNKISVLPQSIGNLRCKYIYLCNNQISVLPESIGNLRCNYISLFNNQIKQLLESFGNIRCNFISLHGNNLSELPKYDKYKFDEIEITDQYINCDGLFSWFNSIKQVGEYTIYVNYNNYIVTKDNIIFAHGDSIRQAISDLIFKLSDRDKSKYIGLDHDKPFTVEQAIVMYRIITGACSSGVEGFLSNKDIPETVTVNYILGMVKESDYGYNEFKEFFKLN